MSSISTAAKKERRWLRQHMGYLRSAVTRELDVISKRISALEDLLYPPRDEGGLPPVGVSSSPFGHANAEDSAAGFCVACATLLNQGKPQKVVQQIHALHVA